MVDPTAQSQIVRPIFIMGVGGYVVKLCLMIEIRLSTYNATLIGGFGGKCYTKGRFPIMTCLVYVRRTIVVMMVMYIIHVDASMFDVEKLVTYIVLRHPKHSRCFVKWHCNLVVSGFKGYCLIGILIGIFLGPIEFNLRFCSAFRRLFFISMVCCGCARFFLGGCV